MLATLSLFAFLGSLAVAQDTNAAFIVQCSKPNTWALTFDDGPSPHTTELLKVLADENVQATFFVNGVRMTPAMEPVLKATHDAGHQIASHTFNHLDLNTLSAEDVRQEMTLNDAIIQRITGETPNYMRPPFGNCNDQCAAVMADLKKLVIQWNVDSHDWKHAYEGADHSVLDAEFDSALVNPKLITAAGGFISLQHDTYDFSVARVKGYITKIKGAGIRITTVQDCLSNGPPAYASGKSPAVVQPTSSVAPTSTSNVVVVTQTVSPTKTPQSDSAALKVTYLLGLIALAASHF